MATKWWEIFGVMNEWATATFEEMEIEFYFYNLDWTEFAERG